VFLAYAGTMGNTGEEEDLFVYLMAIPDEKHLENKLTLDEIVERLNWISNQRKSENRKISIRIDCY